MFCDADTPVLNAFHGLSMCSPKEEKAVHLALGRQLGSSISRSGNEPMKRGKGRAQGISFWADIRSHPVHRLPGELMSVLTLLLIVIR